MHGQVIAEEDKEDSVVILYLDVIVGILHLQYRYVIIFEMSECAYNGKVEKLQ